MKVPRSAGQAMEIRMKIEDSVSQSLFSLLWRVLLSCGLAAGTAYAQGLGDFSAPPPESVKRVAPEPAKKSPPRQSKPRSRAPRYEELTWFSRAMLCSGNSQRCEEAAKWPMRTGFSDDYFLTLTVPSKYCSPVYLDVELDGRLLGSSGLLGPGRTAVLSLGEVSQGSHAVRISALGNEGGCNGGALQTWGIDLALSNNPENRSLAKAPIQTTNAQRAAASSVAPKQEKAQVKQAERREEPIAPARPSRGTGPIQIVNVSGRELTGLNAFSLLSSLSLAKDKGARGVVVNLERVTYMTEPGVDALVQGEELLGPGNLALVNLLGEPRRILEDKVPGHFKIYSSKADAVAALRR